MGIQSFPITLKLEHRLEEYIQFFSENGRSGLGSSTYIGSGYRSEDVQ